MKERGLRDFFSLTKETVFFQIFIPFVVMGLLVFTGFDISIVFLFLEFVWLISFLFILSFGGSLNFFKKEDTFEEKFIQIILPQVKIIFVSSSLGIFFSVIGSEEITSFMFGFTLSNLYLMMKKILSVETGEDDDGG